MLIRNNRKKLKTKKRNKLSHYIVLGTAKRPYIARGFFGPACKTRALWDHLTKAKKDIIDVHLAYFRKIFENRRIDIRVLTNGQFGKYQFDLQLIALDMDFPEFDEICQIIRESDDFYQAPTKNSPPDQMVRWGIGDVTKEGH